MWRMPDVRVLVSDFLTFSHGRRLRAAGLISAGALLEGVGVIMLVPIVSLILEEDGRGSLAAPLFDALGLETGEARMTVVLAVFAVVIVLRFIALQFRDDLLARLQEDFVSDLRARAFLGLARKPWAEVARLRHGPVGHALIRDADRAAGSAGQLVAALIAAIMLVVQLAIALALAPLVTLIVSALGLALFRALRRFRERAEAHGADQTWEDLAMFEAVGAFLDGLKPAKAHGLERDYLNTFRSAALKLAEIRRAFAWDLTLARLVLQSAAAAIAIAAVMLGLFVLDTPPGNLVVTLVVLARLYGPVHVLQFAAQGIRHVAPGYRAIRQIAGPPSGPLPAICDGSVAGGGLEVPPRIDLVGIFWADRDATDEGVEASGGAGAAVLDDISAAIPAGEVTVILGDSGAGKSTLCDVATLLLAPVAGQVQIDGAPADEAIAARLRASLAYVGQEAFLFDGSLRENLGWGAGPLDDAQIWAALEIVGAAGLVRGLEGGLDGRLRAEGRRFSGGERQRLRLARALLRRPKFLVLDEATNALDLEAEAQVLGAVLAARNGATVMMVSHRPGNIGLAGHAIVLERGRLSETGAVGDLLADPASRLSVLARDRRLQPVPTGGTTRLR